MKPTRDSAFPLFFLMRRSRSRFVLLLLLLLIAVVFAVVSMFDSSGASRAPLKAKSANGPVPGKFQATEFQGLLREQLEGRIGQRA